MRSGSGDPVVTSAGNFARTLPMCLVLLAATWRHWEIDRDGLILALVSGVVTSGLGYVVWYRVLKQLNVLSASTLQLSVPVLAALMGVVWLGEPLTLRLIAADVAVLLGVGLVLRNGEDT